MNWSKHCGTWFLGSVCEKHIDDLSQVVTNSSRIQLLHDAALIGKAVRRPSQAGPNPVLQIDSLGKRQIDGKAYCWSSRVSRCSHMSWGSTDRPGDRNCTQGGRDVRQTDGSASGKADEWPRVKRLCKMNSEAHKLTMTDIHPVKVYGHTAQGASTAQVNAMCRNWKIGTVMGRTQACAISTVAWFFGERAIAANSCQSGPRCGGASMSRQSADFARSGEKDAHFGK